MEYQHRDTLIGFLRQIRQIRADPEQARDQVDELVRFVQFFLVDLYMQAKGCEYSCSVLDEDEAQRDNGRFVICQKCAQYTLYSAQILLPGVNMDQMCLSPECIREAIFEAVKQLDDDDELIA